MADNVDGLKMIHTSVNRSVPYGRAKLVDKMVSKYHLKLTLKSPGVQRMVAALVGA